MPKLKSELAGEKRCSKCGGSLDKKGARGLCHKCYENWRWHQKDPEVRAREAAEMYQRNKGGRKAYAKAYRQANLEKLRQQNREYYEANKEKIAEYGKKWREVNKDKIREDLLYKKFGITLEDYACLLSLQDGACAICSRTDSGDAVKEMFCVDHDHATGEIRGLLCSICNLGIGMFEDSPERLVAAAEYIRRYESQK